jgi:cyanate permease
VGAVAEEVGAVGAAIFPFAIGYLRQATGNWNLTLFIFAAIFVLDAICWALLNPKRPLFEEP